MRYANKISCVYLQFNKQNTERNWIKFLIKNECESVSLSYY